MMYSRRHLSRLAYHFVSITRLQRAMRRQAVINRASGTTTGISLWRIVMPHFAKASAAETVSVAIVGLNGTLIPSARCGW